MEKTSRIEGSAVPLRRSNVDTDQILPAVYLKRVTKTGYEDALFNGWRQDPEFVLNRPEYQANPRILLVGPDFGTGSSREHAPVAIKASGITCVIAANFARLFYRNAINIGLPLLEVGEDVAKIKAGDTLSIDLETGEISNTTTGEKIQGQPLPGFIQDIARAGGLINYVKGSAQ